MLRQGLITEIQPDKGTCRVKFLDDDIVSKPLQICVSGSMANKFYLPFQVNELVACMMDANNEDGVVVGALYSNEDTPSGTTKDSVRMVFADGSIIDYNFSDHKFTIDVPDADVIVNCKKADVTATGKVTLTASAGVEIIGDVKITGSLNATGGMVTAGSIKADGEVTAGVAEIKLSSHLHGGVQPGGGSTGVPLP